MHTSMRNLASMVTLLMLLVTPAFVQPSPIRDISLTPPVHRSTHLLP